MRDEHLFRDANGNETFRRLDPDPAVADAWTRLAEGNPAPSDVTLLDRSLAEANFLIRDPYATYDQARDQAARLVPDRPSHEPSNSDVSRDDLTNDTVSANRQEPQPDPVNGLDGGESQPDHRRDQPSDGDQPNRDDTRDVRPRQESIDERHTDQSQLRDEDAPPPDDAAPYLHDHDADAPPLDERKADQSNDPGATLPGDLRRIYDESTETPAGRAFYESSDIRMQDAANRVPPDPGRYTVDVHTTADHAFIGGRSVTAAELATVIRSDPNYDGRPIRLIGCEAGSRPDGLAAQLARELGVDVAAPTTRVSNGRHGEPLATDSYVDDNGVRRRVHPPNGIWNVFCPDGSHALVGDPQNQSGYLPHADDPGEVLDGLAPMPVQPGPDEVAAAVDELRRAFAAGEDLSSSARVLADLSTNRVPPADRVVLGRYAGVEEGYIGEARRGGGVWFSTPPGAWEQLTAGLSAADERRIAWAVNEQFLQARVEEGVPRIELMGERVGDVFMDRPVSYARQEMEFLRDHAAGHGYVRNGETWTLPDTERGTGELRQSGEPVPGGNALHDESSAGADKPGQPFPNELPDQLSRELDAADNAGVTVVTPGTPSFDELINGDSPSIKWAILQSGELVVIPAEHGGSEVPHSVLSRGEAVLAAGEAEVVGTAESGYIGLEINNHSGHFMPSADSLDIGLRGFGEFNILFAEEGIDRIDEG